MALALGGAAALALASAFFFASASALALASVEGLEELDEATTLVAGFDEDELLLAEVVAAVLAGAFVSAGRGASARLRTVPAPRTRASV